MGKHAYLIIAHNKFELLKNQIMLLQDPRNDIYVHLDKKVDINEFKRIIGEDILSQIIMVKRVNVKWGGYSQIQSEMNLIKAAVKNEHYDYLHLLSGVDLPIKSQNYIHEFFDSHQGNEFVDYDHGDNDKIGDVRCKYYYLLQNLHGRRDKCFLMRMDYWQVRLQKKLGINRTKNIREYMGKGPNWFSITSDFAKYVVENEKIIKNHFYNSFCGDEVFLHTVLNMSPFRKKIYHNQRLYDMCFYTNFRCVDWERGNPYVFKDEDLEILVDSEYLFARKFDENISIEKLKELIRV